VRLTVTAGGNTTTDTVVLREAPVLTHHHLQQAEQLMATRISEEQAKEADDPTLVAKSARFIADLTKTSADAGLRKPPFAFTRDGDMFPQDFFEPMYTSMPGPGGRPHGMRVLFRAHHESKPNAWELYERLRGPDVGVVQLAADNHDPDGRADTLDSTGNLETIPPYSHNGHSYPNGRVIMGMGVKDPAGGPQPGGGQPGAPGGDAGSTPGGGTGGQSAEKPVQTAGGEKPERVEPSPAVQTFITSQGMQGPPLLIDTSFTVVQHVDEMVQFLPANTPRGWRVAVADPEARMKLLRDAQAAGHGNAELEPGAGQDSRLKTIDDYLNDKDPAAGSAGAVSPALARVPGC